MINFYRKIRRQLLTEKKLGHYLKYALGEIILVVIGILIALQVTTWNEMRKKETLGKELSNKLYEELQNTHEYLEQVLKNYDRQIGYIEKILTEGETLDVNSFIRNNRDYWAVLEFGLPTYILFFTEFYTPNNQYYKTFVNDGSLSIIENTEFVKNLDYIYEVGPMMIQSLLNREIESNVGIGNYISGKYGYLFKDQRNFQDGSWDFNTEQKLLEAIRNDGTIRFKLEQKLSMLKSKKTILKNSMSPRILATIKAYKP